MDHFHTYLPYLVKIGIGLIVFVGFLIASLIFYAIMLRVQKRFSSSRAHVVRILSKLVRDVVIIIGAICAIGTTGVNVSALVASLGLVGFAVGFALKDFLSNVMAGLLIMLHQPIKIGDQIVLSGFEGKVAAIDLRYTTLHVESKKILVPNASILNNVVTVFNQS